MILFSIYKISCSLSVICFTIALKICVGIFHWCCPRNKDIADDIILITGGGHGIGRKLALLFAQSKPKHIILWGRQEYWLKKTSQDIESLGVPCTYQICDVSSKETIYAKAEELQQTVGDVTILVNNAGVIFGKQLIDSDDEDIVQAIKVNALAHIWTIKSFLPAMIERKKGHIVCMCSILGQIGLKGTAEYSTSKYALTGLMESLAAELQDYPQIITTILHPYQVDNSMFSGCSVRFPWLFRLLSEDHVVELSVRSVLQNRRQIVCPWYWYFIIAFKAILPITSLYPVLQFFGVDQVMDNFRKNIPASQTEQTRQPH